MFGFGPRGLTHQPVGAPLRGHAARGIGAGAACEPSEERGAALPTPGGTSGPRHLPLTLSHMPRLPLSSPPRTRRAPVPHGAAPTQGSLYDRIVDTCEALIRRYGPDKATVADVARALGMSPGNVYRHVESKAALREAVVERWLLSIEAELAAAIVAGAPAAERIGTWLRTLAGIKRTRFLDDPELFATYASLGDEQQGAVVRHLQVMVDQLSAIIEDGVRTGEFAPRPADTAARALLDGTSAFHNPHRVPDTTADPAGPQRLEAILELLLAGLHAEPPSRATAARGRPTRRRR